MAIGARPLLAFYALVTLGAYGYLALPGGSESFPQVYVALVLSALLTFLVLRRSRLAWIVVVLYDAAWVLACSGALGDRRVLPVFVLKALSLALLLAPDVRAHVWHRPRARRPRPHLLAR